MSRKINVMLIDDHPMICQGISALLAETDDIVVCVEAYDGHQALALCKEYEPDIAVIDIIMPEMDGIEIAEQMLAMYPQMRIIALTSVVEEKKILDMIHVGASGFLFKNKPLKQIAQIIRIVYDGYTIFPDEVMQKLTNSDQLSSQQSIFDYDLTRREVDVLRQLLLDYSNYEIAEELSLSVSTVKTHLVSIFRKLDVGSRTEAINLARSLI